MSDNTKGVIREYKMKTLIKGVNFPSKNSSILKDIINNYKDEEILKWKELKILYKIKEQLVLRKINCCDSTINKYIILRYKEILENNKQININT